MILFHLLRQSCSAFDFFVNWHLGCSLHAARKAESASELVPTRSGPRHPDQSTLQQGWTFSRDLLFCTVMLFLYVFINEFKFRQMELSFSTQLLYQVPRGY
jgi:hypothetical protein